MRLPAWRELATVLAFGCEWRPFGAVKAACGQNWPFHDAHDKRIESRTAGPVTDV
jgi:hypothetical protein